ncbi:MAG: hypothetical protein GKR89_37285 [Candidatus Latescibacteria bacterium]|nr:hypothetical protein [Candidatus Latescibacterota bacterium]
MPTTQLPSPISEIRQWEWGNRQWTGATLARDNRVILRLGLFFWQLFNDAEATIALGNKVGRENGSFIAPLSLAAGADERLYVLDAGNARIQVFDREGQYITQWGSPGSTPGAFDFGGGATAEEFAGSIAVGQDGCIYVADVFNRRIQKFAP